jgi:NADP-dependent 3-hydroxy acid dehydrogenase YdfG
MKDKAIIVTGASSGIGKALAKNLAAKGYAIFAVARSKERLEALAKEHANIIPVCADITVEQDRKSLIVKVAELGKPVDVVNNAGVAMPKSIDLITDAEWHKTFKTNVDAPYWLFRDCLPYFDQSRVLNISSGLAHSTLPGTGVYSITKAALYMLYQVINTDLEPSKVIAGSLRPGIIDTEMQQQLRSKDVSEFPSVAIFKGFHEQKQLRDADDVAEYIANVLLNTTDADFKLKEWNIDD